LPISGRPIFRIICLLLLALMLLYLPTREFLKITIFMAIPFIFVLGFRRKPQASSVIRGLSVFLLLIIIGIYGYLIFQLPERIETRRIITQGGSLVAEGKYDQAIKVYSKLKELGQNEKMKEKIQEAEKEKTAAALLEDAQNLMAKGNQEEALIILKKIPPGTRAANKATKIISEIKR
jgi:tetratricopeptide (TPR) repeat protein